MKRAVWTADADDQSGQASAAIHRSQACQLRQRALSCAIRGTGRKAADLANRWTNSGARYPIRHADWWLRHAGSSLRIPLGTSD